MMSQLPLELPFRIAALVKNYIAGNITPDEQAELDAWINLSEKNRELWAEISQGATNEWTSTPLHNYNMENVIGSIHHKIKKNKQRRTFIYLSAAAAILIMIAVGLQYLKAPKEPAMEYVVIGNEVPPGTTKARLVMANGHTIGLDKARDSSFTEGNGVQVQQQQGVLSYLAKNNTKEMPTYNTLITPKGGEYKLVLGDGTVVWLNAASSIRFPNRFSGNQREVQLTGEAYFEVTHDPKRPFIVAVNGTEVQVLGTAFDIRAYQPAITYTTLVNGAVRVASKGSKGQVLQPGQMARSGNGGLSITNADIEQVTAWKNKQIILRDADLRDIMEELSRWYNVDVVYAGDFNTATGVTIEISREVPLKKILEMIMLTKSAKFRIDGDVVTVLPFR
ncbi:FecR family protein [Chitinophaga sp. LS1]|uniref:FecR family protein n=1 Tax=Chitinophaga sp. LS1 TaxID=3051176 RepID=UPI002AAAA376|nr:FecR domain-containing protein [Chitinophaga sp. LS1]WPV66043.1 FecR domain-containing protein [Chitinophaga sp. LS1]